MDDNRSIKRTPEVETEEETLQDHGVTLEQLHTPTAAKTEERKQSNDKEDTKKEGTEELKATEEESQPTSGSLFEARIHNETSERLNDVTFKWLSNLNSGFSIHEATKGNAI